MWLGAEFVSFSFIATDLSKEAGASLPLAEPSIKSVVDTATTQVGLLSLSRV